MQILPSVPQEIIKGGKKNFDNDTLRIQAYCEAFVRPFTGGRYGLLSVENDTKTRKSVEKVGVLTGVLYLAPADLSGTVVCPSMTPGCQRVCLFTSGHGIYRQSRKARLRKTYIFLYRQVLFFEKLNEDIHKLKEEAARRDLKPAIRLNGTSDIDWENIPIAAYDGKNIFEVHDDIPAYDYTKVLNRLAKIEEIPNYSVVFSQAETTKSKNDSEKAAQQGVPVTVVFDKVPELYNGVEVIDGDLHDYRLLDVAMAKETGKHRVIGLKAKGKARKDSGNGFVIKASDKGYGI